MATTSQEYLTCAHPTAPYGDRPNATMSGWTRAEPSSPRCTQGGGDDRNGYYTPVSCCPNNSLICNCQSNSQSKIKTIRPLVITGATGTLGRAFARAYIRGIPYSLLTRQEMDITDLVSVNRVLTELNPWAVVNAAGYVR